MRGLPSSETKVPFDEPSRPSLLPAQHHRAGAGEAEGPRTLPPSPFCATAARGSPPSGTVPRPQSGTPGTVPTSAPSQSRTIALGPASILCPAPVCLMAAGPCGASCVPCPKRVAAGVTRAPCVGSRWGPGLSRGPALSPALGTASPRPCCPRHPPGLCPRPWLCPLRPGSPPPPEGLLPPPVPFNSNNGQASAPAARSPAACLSLRLRPPAAWPGAPCSRGHGAGQHIPSCSGLGPQHGQGPSHPDSALRGCPGPLLLPLGRAVGAAGPGRSGGGGASATPALPAPCLCWAEPGVPAAPAP